jgi:hypothetical protein
VLFTTIEDETDTLQAVCVGDALQTCTPVFLIAPAVLVQGVIDHRGKGTSIRIEKARPVRFHDFLEVAPIAPPPADATKTLIPLLIDGPLIQAAPELVTA